MKGIRYIAPLAALLILGSCKKHKLTGLRSIFVGEWEWVHSLKFTGYNTPPFGGTQDTIFASDVSSTYRLNFLEKGKIQFIENGIVQNEYRTVFSSFINVGNCSSLLNSPYQFSIDLDNDDENSMNGCINTDSLVTYTFPFPREESAFITTNYWHYFKKVN